MTSTRSIQLLLKMTDQCNMRCSYCSDRHFRALPHTITPEVISSLPRLFALLAPRFTEIDVIFHGGEPFCSPPSRFNDVFRVLSEYNPFYSAQTNLYALRLPAYANILSRLRSLSLTIDGPRPVHDAHRVDCHGNGTFDRIANNLSRLRAEYPSLQIGALFTVSRESMAFVPEIYQLFRELRIKHVGFNPVVCGAESLTPQDYFLFLRELFTLWSADPDPLDVHLFSEITKYLTGMQATPSTCYGVDCYRNIISVSPLGNINPCMHWHDDSRFTIDSIKNLDDYWIYYANKISSCVADRDCGGCAFVDFCRGGCPHEYSGQRWLYCSPLQAFLRHVQDFFTAHLKFAVTPEYLGTPNGDE